MFSFICYCKTVRHHNYSCCFYSTRYTLHFSYGFALEESKERERGAELCRKALSMEKRLPFATHGLGMCIYLLYLKPILSLVQYPHTRTLFTQFIFTRSYVIQERVLSSLFGHDLIGQENSQDISRGILYSTILV